jgi:hypothetical protein
MVKLNSLRFFVLSLFLFSCGGGLYLNVLQPADINLPSQIKSFAVGNRTRPAKENQAANIIEGVFSGEGIGEDRAGAESCVNGFFDKIQNSPKFSVINLVTPQPLKGTGTGDLPEPLDYREAMTLCSQNNVDALLLLEAFDSNTGIQYGQRKDRVRNPDGTFVEVILQTATARVNITHVWRMYGAENGNVIDEYRGNDFMTFTGSGPNQQAALMNLPARAEIIKRTAYHAGSQYAYRVSPMYVNVYRSYYKNGSDEFKSASRFVRVNDWEKAMKIWESIVKEGTTKETGKAYFNLALGNEVYGNLEKALEKAKKAYSEFGNKKALQYVNTLENRLAAQQRLENQMK